MTFDPLAVTAARRLYISGEARRIREAAALSRPELARALGVTSAAVEAWESGRRHPGPDNALRAGALLRALARQVAA